MPAGTPRTSAAALSAAVDSTKSIVDRPYSQAEPPMQKRTRQTPAALRERGVWGERRFSQRSGLSPQHLPVSSLREGARGRGFSQRSRLPRIPPHVSYSQPLFGRGGLGERRFSQRSGLSPSVSQRRQVAAALSAAVTTTKLIGDAPTLHGRTSSKERASLFPATLRERGSGGEALLLEKRPLPQRSPHRCLFGRGPGGGASL